MSELDERFASMRCAVALRTVPDFDDVLRRRQRAARRRLAAGSAMLVAVGAAGAGAYLALPGAPTSQRPAQLAAAGSDASGQAAPEMADGSCTSVRLATDAGTGGQSDPVAAAAWFAKDSADGYPVDGWHVVYESGDVAQVESGATAAFVLREADGSWQVIAAQRCE